MKSRLLIAAAVLAAAFIQTETSLSGGLSQLSSPSEINSPFEINPSYKGRDGAAEAKEDISRGSPKLKAFGLLTPSSRFYSMLLSSRLGIQQETIAGCVVTEDLTKYANAYNTVIEKWAKKKFGDDIFEQLMTEAEQLYRKYPTMDETWVKQHVPPIPSK